ncbi:unnamed protein product [Trifolium pratense]|uniref:Uncharacterized protein n=1 Tax=Trifolium pratense TaxID=57577 RepID=A0ACB0KZU5_TRIPR|nr:unnamed protein product [Trifolium pratense]
MAPSPVFFPEDLIGEIFSVLPVKSILRFRCLSKSYDTLISHPVFVKLHLKKSTLQNPQFLLITDHDVRIPGPGFSPDGSDAEYDRDRGIIPYSIRSLFENPSFTISVDPFYLMENKGCSRIVGSCNGLICLAGDSYDEYQKYWLRLWNPATRIISPTFGYFHEECNPRDEDIPFLFDGYYKFSFGCDNSTDTYKVVAYRYNKRQRRSNVRILSLGDNVWRDIESFPVDPILLDSPCQDFEYDGLYFRSTINWLAIPNEIDYNVYDTKDIPVEQFVIVSLDLTTETYNRYLLPRDFDEMPHRIPTICLLGDSLCFSYFYKKTDFIIWQMKKFGVEDSWTQFLKVSCHNLQIDDDLSDEHFIKYSLRLEPLFLSEDGDTLVLDYCQDFQAIIYNRRNNRVERTNITALRRINDDGIGRCTSKYYFESLVSVF